MSPPVWRLLLAIGLFQSAFFLPWIAAIERAEQAGWGAGATGLLGALPWVAALGGLAAAPRLIGHAGIGRCVLAAAGLHLAGAALVALGGAGAGLWAGVTLLGLGFALRWTAVDAWLAAATPRRLLGSSFGIAETVAGVAMLAAPLGVLGLGATVAAWGACGATLLATAVLPWRSRPRTAGGQARPGLPLAGFGLLGLAAVWGGAFESGYMGAVPLIAGAEALAAGLLAASAVAAGSLVAQAPWGWAADRWGAGRMLRAASLVLTVALAATVVLPPGALPLVAAVVGAAGGGLYTLAVIAGLRRADPGGAPGVVALAAGAYTAGATAAPALSGLLLDAAGPGPTLGAMAAASAGLLVVLARGGARPG